MSSVEATDRELIQRTLDGDHRAFDVLVRRHEGRIHGLLRRMVSRGSAAEDLTQEVFVKAFRALARFQGRSDFATWLYRIALNHARDHRASREARTVDREVSLDDPDVAPPTPVSPAAGPDDDAVGAQMAGAMQRSLEALDPALREAFVLRHQEDLGYDAIAEVQRITRANAKVRVHRARERILEALRDEGYDV